MFFTLKNITSPIIRDTDFRRCDWCDGDVHWLRMFGNIEDIHRFKTNFDKLPEIKKKEMF